MRSNVTRAWDSARPIGVAEHSVRDRAQLCGGCDRAQHSRSPAVEHRSLAFYPSARTTHRSPSIGPHAGEPTAVTTTAQDRPTRHNRRKVLVPLATVLVAGAVAVGSGATFT